MKYVNTGIVFQEIPDEVTLSINISSCPVHCPACHSKYLWEDIGEPLTALSLGQLLGEYGDDITCVAFMGGDGSPADVNRLAAWVRQHYPALRVAWYSGRGVLAPDIDRANFDFIKLGPYVESRGPINRDTTNQRMFRVGRGGALIDITKKFWKK